MFNQPPAIRTASEKRYLLKHTQVRVAGQSLSQLPAKHPYQPVTVVQFS
jgi:hypothetical protein